MRQCPYCGCKEERVSLDPCSECKALPLGQLDQDAKGDWWDSEGQFVTTEELRLGWRQGTQRLVDREHLAYLANEHRCANDVALRLRDIWKRADDKAELARRNAERAEAIYLALHPEEEIVF